MSTIYSLYKELLPPSVVEHVTESNFTSEHERNLIIARSSLLEIYRCIEEDDSDHDKNCSTMKFELVDKFSLNGVIESVQTVRLLHRRQDSLALSFKDAKISIVDYDSIKRSLITVSLHCFEDEDLKKFGYTQVDYSPMIKKDTSGRCLAMQITKDKLAIIPFRQEHATLDTEEEMTTETGIKLTSVLPSFILDLQALDGRMRHVRCIEFLHGYYEPTIAILVEPLPTWTGRLAVRKDSIALIVIALDLIDRHGTIIWSRWDLPYDCERILAVPRPIGGILIFSTNGLIHVDQIHSYGISVNDYSLKSSNFGFDRHEIHKINLNECVATLISHDQCLIILESGKVYLAKMLTDGRTVMKITMSEIDEIEGKVSCAVHLKPSYMFFGSYLGDSIVCDISNLKHFSHDTTGSKGHMKSTYLRECDRFDCFAPITDFAVGFCDEISKELSQADSYELELVASIGRGRTGAIGVFHRQLRPDILYSYDVGAAKTLFSLRTRIDKEDTPGRGDTHLILSFEDRTVVLEASKELNEMDRGSCPFSLDRPTVFVGTLSNERILQVCDDRLVLISSDLKLIKMIELEFPSLIAHCLLIDYSIVLRDRSGKLHVYSYDETTIFSVMIPDELKILECASLSAVKAKGNCVPTIEELRSLRSSMETHVETKATNSQMEMMDAVDLEIYGETLIKSPQEDHHENVDTHMATDKSLLFVLSLDGSLAIFELPLFKQVFYVASVQLCSSVLFDATLVDTSNKGSNFSEIDTLVDFKVINFQRKLSELSTLLLIIRTVSNHIMIYESNVNSSFTSSPHHQDRLAILFNRHSLPDIISCSPLSKEHETPPKGSHASLEDVSSPGQISIFDSIHAYSGVFISGEFSRWILLDQDRGSIYGHPMWCDGGISCFTSFHSYSCASGFAYVTLKGQLRVCQLDSRFNYLRDGILLKRTLGRTVYKIAHHPDTKTYSLLTGHPREFLKPADVRPKLGDSKDLELNDSRIFSAQTEQFTLDLVSPITWNVVDSYSFDEYEHGVCMKTLLLHSSQTVSGLKSFLVVGTATICGEEHSCRGKIVIFEIIEVVPEPGKPETKHKLKLSSKIEVKGPVSAIHHSNGDLIVCLGSKVLVYSFEDEDNPQPISFLDAQVFVSSVSTLKEYILIGDVCKSVWFLRSRIEPPAINLLGKDDSHLGIYATEFLIDDHVVHMLVADSGQNLIQFSYCPEDPLSLSGQKLLRRADFHLGSYVTKMQRIGHLSPSETIDRDHSSRQHLVILSMINGSIGYLTPIHEETYRRLYVLQSKMTLFLQHLCGLNPKAFRSYQSVDRSLKNLAHNIIDGSLVYDFLNLSVNQRLDFSRQVGMSADRLQNELIQLASHHEFL